MSTKLWNGDMVTADGLRKAKKLMADGSMARMSVQYDRENGSRLVVAADVADRWGNDQRTVYLDLPTESGWCGVAGERVGSCYGSVLEAGTVLDILRAGDELRLIWYRGGAESPVIREAGLVGDSCSLHIRRNQGRKRLVLPISYSVCKDNSARMIRMAEYSVGV